VRAAAGRAAVPGPTVPQPRAHEPTFAAADPPVKAEDSVTGSPEGGPPGPVPPPAVPAPAAEGSASPAPDAEAARGSDGDGQPACPEPGFEGNGRADPIGLGFNGDLADEVRDGNGRPPEPGDTAGHRSDDPLTASPASWTTAWSVMSTPPAAAETGPDAAPTAMPTPRPEHVDAARRPGGSAPDARDRLLAVLLDDPERAVGAAVELEACLRELDRLSDAVRKERGVLPDVLLRLAGSGLRPEQLARLAGMPLAEVEKLLGAKQQV
jgi:hypothetical protein